MVYNRQDLSFLPDQFVVFDLETTGLKPDIHEIIEIGAIKVSCDTMEYETFQSLVIPRRKIPQNIMKLTGITQDLIEMEGHPPESVLPGFFQFTGGLPLVAFNAGFDIAFLKRAAVRYCAHYDYKISRVSCALKMARRAWPGRKSYRLADISRDRGLSPRGAHRAIGDCMRTMFVYKAAASVLRSDR